MQARFIVETRQWQIGEVNSEVEDAELLASGISAFHLDRPRVLAAAAAEFAQRKQSRPDDIDLAIRERELSALLSLQEGNPDRASAAFEEALSLTDSKSPPRGPVTPIKPAHELYGEAMLAAGRYQQAAELFEQSLLLTPNRPWSLLGLARAYANLDQVEAARESYEKLGGIWSGNDELPGYQEATEYLADQ
ncbi:MAG: tetratricopeptide repeat protein, partial [Pseudohongiellaceae bacterium]